MFRIALALMMLIASFQAHAQARSIHIIYMGGNDCPPCVFWRATELPKLQATQAYASIRFSSVTKTVRSPVPPAFFLPDEVKPYKDKLDKAGGGRSGSPQTAVLVDGEVYDYYFGTSRSAEDVERMILAIQSGRKYPFKRCVERDSTKKCVERG